MGFKQSVGESDRWGSGTGQLSLISVIYLYRQVSRKILVGRPAGRFWVKFVDVEKKLENRTQESNIV